jgi:hypothetical protein
MVLRSLKFGFNLRKPNGFPVAQQDQLQQKTTTLGVKLDKVRYPESHNPSESVAANINPNQLIGYYQQPPSQYEPR